MTSPAVSRRPYGTTAAGEAVEEIVLTNPAGMEARVITYGGTLTALRVPDRDGRLGNVALGRADLAAYEAPHPYLGAIVGRCANRIARGRFTLDGVAYELATNDGPNHLHGGRRGFDRRVWRADVVRPEEASVEGAVGVRLQRTSPDGEEGYPGTLEVAVTYTLTPANELRLDYEAVTDAPTLVNPSHHAYWNLAGEGAGTIDGHLLEIDAERFTPVDEGQIPTGELAPVAGTPFDFREPRPIGPALRADHPQLRIGRGIDHNFVLRRTHGALARAARVLEPTTGRALEVWTTEPGLQVYTGNFLDGSLAGSSGGLYRQGDGLALETQGFPDAPNRPEFPSVVLRPGERYASTTVLRFGTF